MNIWQRGRRTLSMALSLCLCAGLTGFPAVQAVTDATQGGAVVPSGQDLVYFDDFGASVMDESWSLYGGDSTLTQQDGVLVCDLAAAPGENGQTGPQYSIPLTVSEAFGGREITVSWKMCSDVIRGIRLNLSPGPDVKDNNEVNIFGNWGVLDNCAAGEWQSFTATRLVEGDMTSADLRLIFKVNGEAGAVYFDDVTVTVSSSKPTIQTEELAPAVLTLPYELALKASGTAPMSWSITSGSLPAGLTLSQEGVLSGTPTETTAEDGVNFTVEVTNSMGTDTKDFSIAVTESVSRFTLYPTEGKSIGNANPLYTQKFGADPWAMEYKGRVYVYMTNDTYEYDGDGKIKDNSYSTIRHINVISSADMVNWTDHGSIPVAGASGIAKWAKNSWAPCAAWRVEDGKDMFYLYFTNGGGGIGVLVGESPVGPWSDPNGKALVSHATENCSGNLVPWCFDPAVFIDDDGAAYLYFGGGIPEERYDDPRSGRVVRLKDNLTEIDGVPQEIAPPYFFEAFAMHKYNGKYYLTYSSNFQSPGAVPGLRPGSGTIAYMTGDSPMGPFTYTGEVLANPGSFGFGGGNNHQCVFSFQNEWYIAYHGSLVSLDRAGKGGYRSTHIDRLEYAADGTMTASTGTKKGIAQLVYIEPYARIEAETIAWNGGIETTMEDPTMETTANVFVTGIEQGDWLSVSGAALGDTSPASFQVRAAGLRGGIVELRSGSPDPDNADSLLLSTLTIPAGDGENWETISAPFTADLTGTQNLFLVFKGDVNGAELFRLDWWQLSRDAEADGNADAEATPDVTANTEASPEATVTPEATPGKSNPWPWVGLGAALVAAAGAVTAVVLKKRKK